MEIRYSSPQLPLFLLLLSLVLTHPIYLSHPSHFPSEWSTPAWFPWYIPLTLSTLFLLCEIAHRHLVLFGRGEKCSRNPLQPFWYLQFSPNIKLFEGHWLSTNGSSASYDIYPLPLSVSPFVSLAQGHSSQTQTCGPLNLLGSVAHAEHAVGEVPVIPESAVGAQELLVVPGFQELLQEIVPVQA